MNITIRGLNDMVFRKFKAKAIEEDMKLGEAATQAMKMWIEARGSKPRSKITEIEHFNWGKGTERTSTEIDKILAGEKI